MLVEKTKRNDGKGYKCRYDNPKTPYQRLPDDNVLTPEQKDSLKAYRSKPSGMDLYRRVRKRLRKIRRIQDAYTMDKRAGKDLKGDGMRPFDFRVEVEAMNVDRSCIWATKRVYSPHFCWAEEKDDPTVTCVFACSELPRENCVPDERGRRFRFAVSPANCYGAHGSAIRSDWMTGKYGLEN